MAVGAMEIKGQKRMEKLNLSTKLLSELTFRLLNHVKALHWPAIAWSPRTSSEESDFRKSLAH